MLNDIMNKKIWPVLLVGGIGLISFLVFRKPPQEKIIPSGCIAWWRFNEGEGNVAHDSVGENDGVISNAIWVEGILGDAVWAEGIDGTALSFSGLHGSNMKFTCEECPDEPYSISLWFKADDLSKGTLIAYNHGISKVNDWTIGTSVTFNDDGYLYVGNAGNRVGVPTTEFKTNRWYHLVVVYNSGSDIKAYVDKVDKTVLTGVPPEGDWWNAFADMVGERLHYDPECVSRVCGGDTECSQCQRESFPFNGTIDEVMIFNKALSENEIVDLYNLF